MLLFCMATQKRMDGGDSFATEHVLKYPTVKNILILNEIGPLLEVRYFCYFTVMSGCHCNRTIENIYVSYSFNTFYIGINTTSVGTLWIIKNLSARLYFA